MNIEVPTELPVTEPAPAERPAPAAPMAEVVREISSDAALQPEAYLRETIVPADGE